MGLSRADVSWREFKRVACPQYRPCFAARVRKIGILRVAFADLVQAGADERREALASENGTVEKYESELMPRC